ncbi:MAG: NlpC/P60 family protein [Actinomycetia bacterium]|nr:NlpC/P60 family protein [Actinomycetes bacterium]
MLGKLRFTVVVAVIAAIVLLLVPASGVIAVPPGDDIATKSQQAAEVSREIDALDKDLAIAAEAFDRVKVELDEITDKVDETRQRLSEIKESLRDRRDILNKRAAGMYKNGRTSMLEVLLRTKDFVDFLEKADYVSRVAQSDAKLITRIKSNRDSVSQLERQLAEQQRQKEGLVQQESAKKQLVQAKLAERQVMLSSLNQDIQRLLAEQVTQQRAADAVLNEQAKDVLVNAPEGGLAKTAMKYLGVVYHWAGAGPGKCPTGEHRICFDCSGLTQYVYKLHGISIPHNAALQFNRGVKLTLQQARSGDLVFFGTPPHHVGMYLGNDMFLHAPRTGDVVKVTRLSSRSDMSGFCRFTR